MLLIDSFESIQEENYSVETLTSCYGQSDTKCLGRYRQYLSRLYFCTVRRLFNWFNMDVPFIGSLLYLGFVFMLSNSLRYFSNKLPSGVRNYLLVGIASLQMCTCSLENAVVFNSYGW